MKNRLGSQSAVLLAILVIALLTAFGERAMGRLWLGPDGRFGWWEGNIWSSEQSQRFADPYSLTHVEHGVIFFALLWLCARRLPLRIRLLLAVLLEAAWELLENSPIIIDRYRSVTIALGYEGDSILNSLSDILMVVIGFSLAARLPVWASVAFLLVTELALLVWVRDNLTLNLLMLAYPVAAVKNWQMQGAPAL